VHNVFEKMIQVCEKMHEQYCSSKYVYAFAMEYNATNIDINSNKWRQGEWHGVNSEVLKSLEGELSLLKP
jgi:hypothetical protein